MCFIIILSGNLLAAVDPPSLRCVAAEANGDVVITWVIPPDPASEFVSYEIHVATNQAGPFPILATVSTYTDTEYTHIAAPAGSDLYYYVITRYDDGGGVTPSAASDTLRLIRPSITNAGDQTGFANISWNAHHVPDLPTSEGWFHIFRKYAWATPWALIDSVQYGAFDYNDPDKVCRDSIYYQIQIGDSSGCSSVSRFTVAEIFDGLFPAIPVLDSVSVDTATGDIIIGWQPSTAPDAGAYLVYHDVNGIWQIDTVYGYLNTSFTDLNSDGNAGPESYGLAAIDTCGVTSPIDIRHQSIFLQVTPDRCQATNSITWTAYRGWKNGVENYRLHYREDNGPWQLLSQNTSSDTSFVHAGLNFNTSYCYLVTSGEKNSSRSSTSNLVCETLSYPDFPEYHYLNYVTITDQNFVEISWASDPDAEITAFVIERAMGTEGNGDNFKMIAEIEASGDSISTYTDRIVNPDLTDYYYRIAVVNNCDIVALYSNVARTVKVVLQSNRNTMTNTLAWNPYEGWDSFGNGVAFYNLYREVGTNGMRLITTLPGNKFSYTDRVDNHSDQVGNFCYYIEAVESEGNVFDFEEVSSSNKVCAKIDPKIFIPNAFSPNGDGINDVFNSSSAFIDRTDFYMAIYSKWGERIFETRDADQGWNGTYHGKKAQEGVYMYQVIVRSADEAAEPIEKRGHVLLVR